MVSCAEIQTITQQAEEKARLAHIKYIDGIKEKTRQYCSTDLSELLKEEANRPSHNAVIYTAKYVDCDGLVYLVERNSEASWYYSQSSKQYHLETLVQFIKDHGFTVTIIDDTCAYNSRRDIPVQKITIKW